MIVTISGYHLGELRVGHRVAISSDSATLVMNRDHLCIKAGEFEAELPRDVLAWLLTGQEPEQV